MLYNPNGKDMKTKVIEDNLNPIFYEVRDVWFDCISLELAPPFVFTVYDTDAGLLDASDDFLGRAVIHLSDINPDSSKLLAEKETANIPPNPKWYGFRSSFDKNVAKSGEICVSFNITMYDFKFDEPVKDFKLVDHVETKEFKIDINCLGLRELQTTGLLPIKKAYVRFNTKSMLPPEKAQVVSNV